MLLMVLSAGSFTNSQIKTKDGKQLKIFNAQSSIINDKNIEHSTLNIEPLTKAELVGVYRYLVELEKVRSDYKLSLKQIDYLKQINGMQSNQLELKEDMIKNLESYAEQVKPEWWQSEIAIIAWIAGSAALTYLIVK